VAEALKLACDRGVDYVELRQSCEVPGDFRVSTHKVSLTMPLKATVEEQWEAAPSERRNRVRKAQKSGLRAEFAGPERLTDFYRVWSHNMRDLGSPAHSLKWFETALETFREHMTLLLIRDDRVFAGAAVLVEYKDTLAVPWVSSLRQHFGRHPNDLLYWEAVKRAVDRGCSRFDFGRSTADSGNFTYKVRWGAESTPIYWQYKALGKGEATLPSEQSAKYNLAVNLWKRMPVGLANWIGPRVRKGITS
jgi:FemAB-related protein (PEP-CTERM system-associated)